MAGFGCSPRRFAWRFSPLGGRLRCFELSRSKTTGACSVPRLLAGAQKSFDGRHRQAPGCRSLLGRFSNALIDRFESVVFHFSYRRNCAQNEVIELPATSATHRVHGLTARTRGRLSAAATFLETSLSRTSKKLTAACKDRRARTLRSDDRPPPAENTTENLAPPASFESTSRKPFHVSSKLDPRLSAHVRWRIGRANPAKLPRAAQCTRSVIATADHLATKAVPCSSCRRDGCCEKVGEGT